MEENDFAIVIKAPIEVVTGLKIGAGKEVSRIGGVDIQVVKNREGLPYIPGSSLKGKIRSLLEQKYEIGHISKWKSENEKEKEIAFIFGPAGNERNTPVMVIFRDAEMEKEGVVNEKGEWEYEDIFEIKQETAIDRIKGNAKKGTLRTMERVRPGIKFNVEIVIKKIAWDQDKNFDYKLALKVLKEGFELLKDDYLGSAGTRGYGKVNVDKIIDKIKALKGEEHETNQNNS